MLHVTIVVYRCGHVGTIEINCNNIKRERVDAWIQHILRNASHGVCPGCEDTLDVKYAKWRIRQDKRYCEIEPVKSCR